jgi:MFS family permease
LPFAVSVSTSDEQLLTGHSGSMLGLLSVGLAVGRVGRRVLPPLLPTIIVALSISSFEAGIALSIASIAFALLQFPSGRLSDQLTRKTVLLASLSLLLVGSVLLSLTTTYLLLLVGAAVAGSGEGLYGAADRGLLSDLFVEKRGVAFGLHTVFSDVGGILAAGLAAGALALGVWQTAFLPAVIGLAAVAFLVYRWGDEPVRVEPVTFGARETVGRLFGRSRFRRLLVAYSLFAITTQGVIGFLPALLQAEHGFSSVLASVAFAGMFATGLVARPAAGRLSDGRNRMIVAGAGLLLGAVGLLALVMATSPLLAVVGVVVFAAGQKAFPPAMQAHLMDSFPDESMAGDLGATRTVYIGIGSVGPAYVGFVAGRLNYTVAFAGFVAAFLVGGLVVLALALTD